MEEARHRGSRQLRRRYYETALKFRVPALAHDPHDIAWHVAPWRMASRLDFRHCLCCNATWLVSLMLARSWNQGRSCAHRPRFSDIDPSVPVFRLIAAGVFLLVLFIIATVGSTAPAEEDPMRARLAGVLDPSLRDKLARYAETMAEQRPMIEIDNSRRPLQGGQLRRLRRTDRARCARGRGLIDHPLASLYQECSVMRLLHNARQPEEHIAPLASLARAVVRPSGPGDPECSRPGMGRQIAPSGGCGRRQRRRNRPQDRSCARRCPLEPGGGRVGRCRRFSRGGSGRPDRARLGQRHFHGPDDPRRWCAGGAAAQRFRGRAAVWRWLRRKPRVSETA